MNTPGTPPAAGAPNPAPYNPYDDGPAAKLWELLRRNKRFRQVARRIAKLGNAPRPPHPIQAESISAASAFRVAIRRRQKANAATTRIGQTHSFAAIALRWLCPDPTFQLIIPKRVDGKGPDGNPCKWDLFWMSSQPHPPPLTVPESVVTKDRPRLDGKPLHPEWMVADGNPYVLDGALPFGPCIIQTEGNKPDLLQVWREDQQNLPLFSIDLAWPQTPRYERPPKKPQQ